MDVLDHRERGRTELTEQRLEQTVSTCVRRQRLGDAVTSGGGHV